MTYLTTDAGYAGEVASDAADGSVAPGFRVVRDASMSDKIGLLRQMLAIFFVLLRVRPDVVVSTGAAPGFFAILLGRFFGARTIWIDSIANAEELSMSGRKVGRYATLWLTQWSHLARPDGPQHMGGVL